MVQRNVSKNQVLAEDIALGVGKVSQLRRGTLIEGSRVDIPVPVYSIQDIKNFSPVVSTRLIFQYAPDKYIYYIWMPSETNGIPSDVADNGVWVPQNVSSDIVLSTESGTTLTVSGENHNQFITLDNNLGCTITVDRAERDIGYGTIPFVPCLVFFKSDSEQPITIQPNFGITIHTPGALTLSGRYSTAAIIATAVDTWTLLGDITVV
jgi:hypothetical protein